MFRWKRHILVFLAIVVTYVLFDAGWSLSNSDPIEMRTLDWVGGLTAALVWTVFMFSYEESIIYIVRPQDEEEAVKHIRSKGFMPEHRSPTKSSFVKKMGPFLYWRASISRVHDYLEVRIPVFFKKSVGSSLETMTRPMNSRLGR